MPSKELLNFSLTIGLILSLLGVGILQGCHEGQGQASAQPASTPKTSGDAPSTEVSDAGIRPAQTSSDSKAALTPPAVFDFTGVFNAVSPSTVGVAAGHPRTRGFTVKQSGSGFVWDDQGHVVTNAHIVAESNRIRVRTKDGRVLRARLVGLDVGTDLAVLKVDSLSLPPVERASADSVHPGQWVAAIGNPFGMDHSITVGVVSAIRRSNLPGGAPKYAEFIQSDASIFPGNSGGPLVNTRAQVIGLNTATLGGGLSFSTRIDMVETVTRRIVDRGRFDRGFAGLYVKHVSHSAAEAAGMSTPRGARVRGLVKDGPAAQAGLKPGDIILKFDSRDIEDSASLPWMIAATPPGQTATLAVARGEERLTLTLTVSDGQ